MWALPVYVLGNGCQFDDVGDVAGLVRYRIDDQDRYAAWLCAGLQRLGHHVSRPDPARPPSMVAHLEHRIEQLNTGRHDDPAAEAWLYAATLRPGEWISGSDSDEFQGPVWCPLWRERAAMIDLLDDFLVTVRGGWQRGTRVRTHAVPYASRSGASAVEAGVFPDRAEIRSPQWVFDDNAHDVSDCPPAGYWLAYRRHRDGVADEYPVGPVPAERLSADLDPLRPVPPSTSGAPSGAGVATDSGPPPRREPAAGTDPAQKAPATADADAVTGPPTTSTGDNVAARYRASALARLWRLHDEELTRVGHTDPTFLARRALEDPTFPQPLHPPTLRDLDQHADNARQWNQRYLLGQFAPWCPADEQLVTGAHRDELIRWVPLVTGFQATRQQVKILDGFTGDTTITDARLFLAREGFAEILDVHGNAGPLPEPHADRSSHTADVGYGPGEIWLVCWHESDGFLAMLSAPEPVPWYGGRYDPSITVYANIMWLDFDLASSAPGSGKLVPASDGQLTTVWSGAWNCVPHRPDGSLAVRLAVVRAFAQPVTPWLKHPVIRPPGGGAIDLTQVLTRLPTRVQQRLGPHLFPPTP